MRIRSCFLLAVLLGAGQSLSADILYSVTELGTLGGAFSYGTAINNAGQVTGASSTSDGFSHAFLYSGGQVMDLSALTNSPGLYPTAINNAGQVTGFSGHPRLAMPFSTVTVS